MKLSVSEFSAVFGVSVRTLHYYDRIGLLKPCSISDAGYRYYNEASVETMQQIMFFRELEFSLKDIKSMFENPNYDKHKALLEHKELLLLRRNHLDSLINIVDNTIGGDTMKKPETTIEDIRNAKSKYAAEAKERWGNTKEYTEFEQRESTDEQQLGFVKGADKIFAEFASLVGTDSGSDDAQILVRKWQQHITDTCYVCSNEILACLAEMYTGDERFKSYIDAFGNGTAEFMSKAIKIHCNT